MPEVQKKRLSDSVFARGVLIAFFVLVGSMDAFGDLTYYTEDKTAVEKTVEKHAKDATKKANTIVLPTKRHDEVTKTDVTRKAVEDMVKKSTKFNDPQNIFKTGISSPQDMAIMNWFKSFISSVGGK